MTSGLRFGVPPRSSPRQSSGRRLASMLASRDDRLVVSQPQGPVEIPLILHRIWVGPDPLPEEFVAYGESWARHHPGWEQRLWTEDDLPEIRWDEIRDRRRVPAERANLLRYELLLDFGCVYVDADLECLR